MYYPIFVDSQSVVLNNGVTVSIDLKYNENTDLFEVTADCSGWANDFEHFCKIDEDWNSDSQAIIANTEEMCKEISGKYETLGEINKSLHDNCNLGDWYEFAWEHNDRTSVK